MGKILWFVPKRLRSNLDSPWRYGIFLGQSMNSDQHFIGVSGGDVVRARAILRLIPEARWDAQRVLGVNTTPLTEHSRFFDSIEGKPDPHEYPAADRAEGSGPATSQRRVKITLSGLQKYRF